MTTDAADPRPGAPAVRVVRGEPTPEELAALVAVLVAQPGAASPAPETRPRTWSAYWRGHRQPVRHGVDGWRGSGRPR